MPCLYLPLLHSSHLFLIHSDDQALKFDAIVCCMGVRYKSYCSNIVRTMLVDPSEDVQKTYEFLVKVEEEILSKLQHGKKTFVVCLLCELSYCAEMPVVWHHDFWQGPA